jgi:hypothetical protein
MPLEYSEKRDGRARRFARGDHDEQPMKMVSFFQRDKTVRRLLGATR